MLYVIFSKLLEIVKVVSMEAPSNSSRPPKQSKVIESEIIEMEHCGQNRYHRNKYATLCTIQGTPSFKNDFPFFIGSNY